VTFSIVAVDMEASEIGVAVQSKFLAVGALVPWVRGGVGAVSTQALVDVTFGLRGLDLLDGGAAAGEVINQLLHGDPLAHRRQVGVVSTTGDAASFTGPGCQPFAQSASGVGFAVQGNLLASSDVVASMVDSFTSTTDQALPDRLIGALRAGQAAGGDRRGQQSAALMVAKPGAGYGGNHDRYIDLRVDNSPQPITELAELLELHAFHFQRPDPASILSVDRQVEEEIRRNLARLNRLNDGRDLWDDLFDFVGSENLEQRWIGRGRIDRGVLEHLMRCK
jgi:uncharacterized Ntn-hydrolase superfamily protein